jgi:hypothetical protein
MFLGNVKLEEDEPEGKNGEEVLGTEGQKWLEKCTDPPREGIF